MIPIRTEPFALEHKIPIFVRSVTNTKSFLSGLCSFRDWQLLLILIAGLLNSFLRLLWTFYPFCQNFRVCALSLAHAVKVNCTYHSCISGFDGIAPVSFVLKDLWLWIMCFNMLLSHANLIMERLICRLYLVTKAAELRPKTRANLILKVIRPISGAFARL